MSTAVHLPAWARDALMEGSALFRALHGGRAGGKSHAIAAALAIKGSLAPLRVLCCREIQNSIAASSKQLIEDKIRALGLSDAYTITDTDIIGRNGTMFLFAGLGSNPDKVKSMEGLDIAWVEEAQAVSQTSLDLLIPTLRKEGAEIWFSWNPDDETGPVDAMFRGPDGPPEGSIVRKVTWRDNPWFSSVSRQQMDTMKRRDPEKWAWVWEGAYRKLSSATVFRNWQIADFDTPADAHFRFGADWGFSVDPTTLLRIFVGRFEDGVAIADQDGPCLFIDHEVYQVGCAIRDTPALFDKVPGSRLHLIKADGARPETIEHMKAAGFYMEAAKKGAGSVADGVEHLKGFDIVVHPRCEHTAFEFAACRFKTDKRTGEVMPVLVDADNHCIDAARYGMEGVRRHSRAWNYVVGNEKGALIDGLANDPSYNATGALTGNGVRTPYVNMW